MNPDSKLSKDYTVRMLTMIHPIIDNMPPKEVEDFVFENLSLLCKHILQPLHDWYEGEFRPVSCYKKIKKISFASPSAGTGQLVSLIAENNVTLWEFIRDNLIFDKMIWNGEDFSKEKLNKDKDNMDKLYPPINIIVSYVQENGYTRNDSLFYRNQPTLGGFVSLSKVDSYFYKKTQREYGFYPIDGIITEPI